MLVALSFLMGAAISAAICWFLYFQWRRDAMRLDEEKQMLTQEKQIVLEFMHSLVEAIGDGVDREELFRRVVHSSILSTGALSACIFDLKEDHLRGVAVEGLFPPHRPLPKGSLGRVGTRAKFIENILRSEIIPLGDGIVGRVALSGEGVLIADATKDDRIVRHEDPALRVRSVIVVPIKFREKVIAVLAIANPGDGMSFTEADLSIAKSIAEQAGLAIHNLDLMAMQIEKNKLDVDLALASNIQGLLLPREFPDIPGLDVGALYLPAQKVGGDLYDVLSLGGSRLGVTIADVSGKGVPASLLMAICQSNFRHLARSFDSPARVLSELNKLMREEMRRDMFVTVTYAIIDSEKMTLTMARAGHELPVLCRSDGVSPKAELLKSAGMALGMAPAGLFDKVLTDFTVPFEPGDVFVLYTDGVTEATNQEGVEFTAGRLAAAVESLRDLPAPEINEAILEQVARFAGGRGQADDVTLLTVKYKPRL